MKQENSSSLNNPALIPPMREQHIKRATVYSNALVPDPELPNPSDWGWVKEAMGGSHCGPPFQTPHRAATNIY